AAREGLVEVDTGAARQDGEGRLGDAEAADDALRIGLVAPRAEAPILKRQGVRDEAAREPAVLALAELAQPGVGALLEHADDRVLTDTLGRGGEERAVERRSQHVGVEIEGALLGESGLGADAGRAERRRR